MLGKSNSSASNSYIKIKNQDITVTENGIYTHETGYTGLGTVTVTVSGSGGGDLVYATNNSSFGVAQDQKVWVNVTKLADQTKVYTIVDYANTNENSITGVAKESGLIGDSILILTVLGLEVEGGPLITKDGYFLTTKANEVLYYK
ncbi:MAG: hypothetical protein IKO49_02225 [Bacilli bacterium]|nr:hypothetical protein [Clostridia bacterium]MBR4618098.1 hypothetical protein [Bacilli bacterium]